MNAHKVTNQSPVIDNINLFSIDPILKNIVQQQNISWAENLLETYGKKLGTREWIQKGKQANENIPKFHPTDEKGFRIDEIEFHPSYHDLMTLATENQIHSLPYTSENSNAHIVRFMLNYLDNQNEAGTNCPLTMTFAAVPPLQKYFDAFLTLAQTEKGLSCFLMPRWKPDGKKNTFHIQRLKDKLGNKSNASSEIEMVDAFGWLLGAEGRGVATIIEMVALTRYDCMIGSSSLMRRGLTEVLQHIKHRSVFGKKLIDQPLMRNVVADLCIELEAAMYMTYRAAQCLNEPNQASTNPIRKMGNY